MLLRSPPEGGSWDTLAVPTGGRLDISPALAIAADGRIGLAFTEFEAGENDRVWFTSSSDRGQSWIEPVLVSRDAAPGNDYEPHLTVDASGRWHLVWLHNTPWILDVDCLYSTAVDDAIWATPVQVNPEPATVAPDSPRSLGIAVDPEGYVYVAWTDFSRFWDPEPILPIFLATTRPRPLTPPPLDGQLHVVTQPNPFRSTSSGAPRIRSPSSGSADLLLLDPRGASCAAGTGF